MGAKAANFDNGKTDMFALTLMWRGKLAEYGKMCRDMGRLRYGCAEWHRLNKESARLMQELAQQGAQAEVVARRHREEA